MPRPSFPAARVPLPAVVGGVPGHQLGVHPAEGAGRGRGSLPREVVGEESDYHLEVSSSMLPHVPLQSKPEALLWSELTVQDCYSCHDGTDCANILIMVFEVKPCASRHCTTVTVQMGLDLIKLFHVFRCLCVRGWD